MSIKCGNCGKHHDSVAGVRRCHGAQEEARTAADVMDEMVGRPAVIDYPSDRQISYVNDLLLTHEWPDAFDESTLRAMDRRQVSRLIEQIKSSPRKGLKMMGTSKFTPMLPDVPAGRYAILKTHPNPEDNSEEGGWDFFQVDKPKDGRWAGHTFLKQLYGAPGDYRKEPVKGPAMSKVLGRIAKDPKGASLDYGKVSGVCGRCSSPLTNKESLDRGIGPICAAKEGW